MIVPMKKVSLVVMERDAENSLERLREAGVLHLEKKSVSSDALGKLLDRRAALRRAAGLLRRFEKASSPADEADSHIEAADAAGIAGANAEGVELVRKTLALGDEKKILQEQLTHQAKERRRIEGWGDFDPQAFLEFAQRGIKLVPYELSVKQYEAIGQDGAQGDEPKVIVINRNKRGLRLFAVNCDIPGAVPFAMPALSLSGIDKRMGVIRNRLADIETELASLARRKAGIDAELAQLQEQIEFETARAGMETLEDVPVSSTVSWLHGFVPVDLMEELKSVAAKNGWALQWEDPAPGDKPPTLVRNNPGVRIIQPLFSFLGTVPGYREYDISASYLVFFCLFFAMIFGDAAYGLLLLAASLVMGFVFKAKSGRFPDAVKLFVLLSYCTVAWGAITGAWFAIPADKLPAALRALIIPPFDNSGPLAVFPPVLRKLFRLPAEIPADDLKTRWNIQFLCFTVGTVQMVWARLKNIGKLMPSPKALAQTGWLVMMIGLYFLVLFMLLKLALPSFAVYLIGGGLIMYYIFAEQGEGNFFKNILKSFANILPVSLNAVGSFADIISYIRLFAVGLAGTSIAQSFNAMAIPAEGFGALGVVFALRLAAAVLILVLGHGLNIMMNALSVIVHGVRLNLLEYAGNHLGMEWSGYAYNPFAVRQKKN
jgi:V/A-type H+-transporting ATPase subunit I